MLRSTARIQRHLLSSTHIGRPSTQVPLAFPLRSFSQTPSAYLRAVNPSPPKSPSNSSSTPKIKTPPIPSTPPINKSRPTPTKQAPIAERPASVPPSITNPSTGPRVSGDAGIGFEPVVNDMNAFGAGLGDAKAGGAEGGSAADKVVPDKAETAGARLDNVGKVESTGSGPTDNPIAPKETEEVFEVPDKPDFSKLPSLDIDPSLRSESEASDADGEGKGRALPPPASSASGSSSGKSSSSSSNFNAGQTKAAPRSLSSIERQRRNLLRLSLLGITIAGAYGAYSLATADDTRAVAHMKAEQARLKSSGSTSPGMTTSELESATFGPPSDGGLESYWLRFKANFTDLLDHFNKPAFEKLLPDPLPPTHQRPYTLLVDLEDMLVKSSWDRQAGWRTAKRPGVDYFLAYLSQFYEIVLFTTQPPFVAMGVADKLDPFQAYLPYRLYRESSRYVKGKIVKDLTYLNRDLSKVILLDTNPEHADAQPENSIILPKWDGTAGDKGLVDYIPFLESIGIFNPPDVRPILKAYAGQNIPTEYAKKEAERKQAAVEEWERDHGSGNGGGGAGWLRSALGGLGGNPVARQSQPTTYLEAKRAQAQQMYKEEQEYWKKNADEIKKLMEEDMQKQLAAQKGTLMGWMAGSKPPAPAS